MKYADVVIIPAFQPDKALLNIVNELSACGFGILIVDDGSGEGYKKVFAQAEKKAKIITHKTNTGKGAALKTAFKNVLSLFPECQHVITADADGQHRLKDIVRVRDELHDHSSFVLTVRRRRKDIKVPLLSKMGNNLSKVVYTTMTGHYFSDNQSGLRGFSAKHLSWLCIPKGEKYDYELNMLLYADKQGIPITTVPIDAIYIDDNRSSHFDPVKDTLRIYKLLFRSFWTFFVRVLLSEVCIALFSLALGNRFIFFTVPVAGIFSAGVDIALGRFVAFRSVKYRDGVRSFLDTVIWYCVYAAACMLFSAYLPSLPLFLSFNITALIFIPVKYYVNKAIHLTRSRDINKEDMV